MRYQLAIVAIGGLALFGGINSCQTKQAESAPKELMEEHFADPGDSSVFNETWKFFADEPNKGFNAAKTQFLAEATKSAVFEIRRAAAYLKLERARGTASEAMILQPSIEELEDLANDVENGIVETVDDFELPFARAQLALARFHQRMADDTWAKKQYRETAEELLAAASDLEYAAEWAGHTLDSTALATLRDTRAVAGRLKQGSGWQSENVQKEMAEFHRESEKINRLLKAQSG
jgi:hypothetical protein